jgi:hypothetical protein
MAREGGKQPQSGRRHQQLLEEFHLVLTPKKRNLPKGDGAILKSAAHTPRRNDYRRM